MIPLPLALSSLDWINPNISAFLATPGAQAHCSFTSLCQSSWIAALSISLWITSTNSALFSNLLIIHYFLTSRWAIKRLNNNSIFPSFEECDQYVVVILASYCSSQTFNTDNPVSFLISIFHAKIPFIYTSWTANLLYNFSCTSFLHLD